MKKFAAFKSVRDSTFWVGEIEIITNPFEVFNKISNNDPLFEELENILKESQYTVTKNNLSKNIFIIRDIVYPENWKQNIYGFQHIDSEYLGRIYQVKHNRLQLQKSVFLYDESDVARGAIVEAETAKDAILLYEVN